MYDLPYNTVSSLSYHILNIVLLRDIERNLPRPSCIGRGSRHRGDCLDDLYTRKGVQTP
jgi:hypothetical protein